MDPMGKIDNFKSFLLQMVFLLNLECKLSPVFFVARFRSTMFYIALGPKKKESISKWFSFFSPNNHQKFQVPKMRYWTLFDIQ